MTKKFLRTLRPDLKVQQTGKPGRKGTVTVTSSDRRKDDRLTYCFDRKNATGAMAAHINSLMPVATIIPPMSR